MIELDNIFYIKLEFGLIASNHLVVANDISDAIVTLKDYYDELNIVYALSAEEIVQLNEEANEKEFFIIIEPIVQDKDINFIHYKEYDIDEKRVLEKYKDKDVILINKESFKEITEHLMEELINLKEKSLISESYALK